MQKNQYYLNFIASMLYCIFYYTSADTNNNNHIKSQDIQKIYSTYVEPNINNEYKIRYIPLPLHKNNFDWKWEGKDFPRVIALLEFERFIVQQNISCKKDSPSTA